MKYLYCYTYSQTFQQTDKEPTQGDLRAVDNGECDILRYEADRGFCRALVEKRDDELEIADWERAPRV